jgi:hypothetical protein
MFLQKSHLQPLQPQPAPTSETQTTETPSHVVQYRPVAHVLVSVGAVLVPVDVRPASATVNVDPNVVIA